MGIVITGAFDVDQNVEFAARDASGQLLDVEGDYDPKDWNPPGGAIGGVDAADAASEELKFPFNGEVKASIDSNISECIAEDIKLTSADLSSIVTAMKVKTPSATRQQIHAQLQP